MKRSSRSPGKRQIPKAVQAKSGGGSMVIKHLPSSNQPPDHWATNYPEDKIIPSHAERVEWADDLVLFRGTRVSPVIVFQMEQEPCHQLGCTIRL